MSDLKKHYEAELSKMAASIELSREQWKEERTAMDEKYSARITDLGMAQEVHCI